MMSRSRTRFHLARRIPPGFLLVAACLLASCGREPVARREILSYGTAADAAAGCFGTTPDADRGLLWFESGWSRPEPGNRVWAVGPASTVRLWLRGRDATVTLRLSTAPDLAARGQEVVLVFNGTELDTLALTRGWEEVAWTVDLPDRLRVDGLDVLTLRPRVHHGPDSAAYAEDPRRHSILLHRLQVHADVGAGDFAVYDRRETPVPPGFLLDEPEGGERSDPEEGDAGPRPDVLVLLLDAARPDHFGCYGYERETTPFIDRLAHGGVVFRQAYATASYTRASIPSLFTGLGWPAHGVVLLEHALADTFVTVAEVFRDAGYRTLGISGSPNASAASGAAQGFGEWVDIWSHPRRAVDDPFELPVLLAEEWLAAGTDPDPVFAYVHLLPPHEPYHPGPKHDLWPVEGAAPWVDGSIESLQRMLGLRGTWDERDLRKLVSLYDGNLHRADRFVERIVQAWRTARGRELRIVLLADHGEALGEGGYVGHNRTVDDAMTRIPLILWPAEAFAGWIGREDELVAISDVFPLLVHELDVALPAGRRWPRRFVELARGETTPREAVVLRNTGTRFGLRTRELLLVTNGWDEQLLHLAGAPGRNLRAERPTLFLEHAAVLHAIVSAHDPRAPRLHEVSPEHEAALRTLGYH
jgi:arylsulfatase